VPEVHVNDIYQLTFSGRCFGQRIMLTHHYIVEETPAGLQVAQACSELIDGVRAGAGGDDLIDSDYRACLPPQYTLEHIVAQSVLPRYRRAVYVSGSIGAHAADTETANQAAVITLQSDFAGRDQVSNKHIGPIPQDVTVQDEGNLTVAYKTLLDTLMVGLLSAVTQIGGTLVFKPVIFHSTGVVNHDILSAGYVQETIRVMRRRTVGQGE